MAEPIPVVISRRYTAIDTLLGKADTAVQPADLAAYAETGDAPTAHAASHAAAGADEITPAAIGAAAANHNHSGTYIEALPAQVSAGEITAGTETELRSYSPADVVAIVDAHAAGGTAWNGDIADINLDGGTDIGADLADADLLLVDDGASGTNRKSAMSRVATYVGGKILTGATSIVVLTEAEYTALDPKVATTLYITKAA